MSYSFTRISKNTKTGPMPTTMSSIRHCPDTCAFKVKGCYAAYGPTKVHWRKLDNEESGMSLEHFCNQIKALPRGQKWRHNVAGDLNHSNGDIVEADAMALVKANKGRNGFTYTHHVMNKHNISVVQAMNANGFVVNVSANSKAEAVQAKRMGLPAVCVLPVDAPNTQTFEGVQIVACPAEKSDSVSCLTCNMCSTADRDYIVGFRAHGTAKKTVDIIARG